MEKSLNKTHQAVKKNPLKRKILDVSINDVFIIIKHITIKKSRYFFQKLRISVLLKSSRFFYSLTFEYGEVVQQNTNHTNLHFLH